MQPFIVLFNPDSRTKKEAWLPAQSSLVPPFGLLAISAPLIKAGYKVRIIDQRTEADWKGIILRELKADPVCVGISLMGGSLAGFALEAAKLVKDNSAIPVIFGGAHLNFLPEQTLLNENIDIVVQGDGEETFLELAQAIKNNASLDGIKGIYYKQEGKIKNTALRPYMDLNKSLALPYHLIDMKRYLVRGPGYRIAHFMSSRGCPFKCTFCAFRYHNPYASDWRALSAEKTLDSLRQLREDFGVNGINFYDANFFVDMERVKIILEGFIKEKFNAPYHAVRVRADTFFEFSDEFLKLLEESGVSSFVIGVESGSEKIQKLLNKKIDILKLIDMNKRIRRFNFYPHYTFMFGFPTEDEEDIRQTTELFLRLIEDNKKASASSAIYSPEYCTELFGLLVKYGLKVPQKLEEWISFSNINDPGNNKPWIDKQRRALLINLRFCSIAIFSARKYFEYRKFSFLFSYLFRLIAKLYLPLAKKRMRNFNFHFFIEKYIAEFIIGKY